MTGSEWDACDDPAAMLAALEDAARTGTGMGPARRRVSDRKLRLFACACCRQVWHLLTDDVPCPHCRGAGRRQITGLWDDCGICVSGHLNRSRQAVEVAERQADRAHTSEEWARAHNEAVVARVELPHGSDGWHAASMAECVVMTHPPLNALLREHTLIGPDQAAVRALQAALLRDVVGNPFKPVTLPPGPLCPSCGGHGEIGTLSGRLACFSCSPGPTTRGSGRQRCLWLTPTVLSLAHAAYDERPGRTCEKCGGVGRFKVIDSDDQRRRRHSGVGGYTTIAMPLYRHEDCPDCRGTGRIEDGTLDPHRLAVLADALEEAGCPQRVTCHGCENESPYRIYCDVCEGKGQMGTLPHPLLAHLRGPGPHARGCWCVDLILGKS